MTELRLGILDGLTLLQDAPTPVRKQHPVPAASGQERSQRIDQRQYPGVQNTAHGFRNQPNFVSRDRLPRRWTGSRARYHEIAGSAQLLNRNFPLCSNRNFSFCSHQRSDPAPHPASKTLESRSVGRIFPIEHLKYFAFSQNCRSVGLPSSGRTCVLKY